MEFVVHHQPYPLNFWTSEWCLYSCRHTSSRIDVQRELNVARVPGTLHGVLDQVDVPVDEVEEGEGQGKEDTGVRVDGAGAGQLRDLRKSRALLEEDRQWRSIFWLTAAH